MEFPDTMIVVHRRERRAKCTFNFEEQTGLSSTTSSSSIRLTGYVRLGWSPILGPADVQSGSARTGRYLALGSNPDGTIDDERNPFAVCLR